MRIVPMSGALFMSLIWVLLVLVFACPVSFGEGCHPNVVDSRFPRVHASEKHDELDSVGYKLPLGRAQETAWPSRQSSLLPSVVNPRIHPWSTCCPRLSFLIARVGTR